MTKNAEIQMLASECFQLRAKLEMAKKALKKYAGGRSQQWRIVDNGEEARETLKQIGE